MVGALQKKLLRELLRLRGQVVTISLVVACGISSYLAMQSAYDSLVHSRDAYYEQYRFADVFATLHRAPRAVAAHIEALAGVARVDTRVVEKVLVPMPDSPRPASGTLIGLAPDAAGGRLNDVHIKVGRALDPARADEVLVLAAFAEAHGLQPGDSLDAVLNGTLRTLRIAGLALSPEFVMAISPGSLSYDPALVPVLWMNGDAVEAAFGMAGGFNDVALQLDQSANVTGVLADVDRLIAPYGGIAAVSRDKQISNYMLQGELTQLASMANFVPFLFLFVAALLVNVVLSRLVQLQRIQIATLKAIGYRDFAIGLHYLLLVSVVVLLGAALGVLLGAYAGKAMTNMYTGQFFRFPEPRYRLQWQAIAFSVGISLASAAVGALITVRQVVGMAPADAMRPPSPPSYKRSVLETVGLWQLLSPATRMIWRELSRRPLRLALSALGIALATGLMVLARSMWDAMDDLVTVQFHRAMREDITVTFQRPVSPEAVAELNHLPGVLLAEGLRAVPARVQVGHRFRDVIVNGYPEVTRLRRVLDTRGKEHPIPDSGVMMTETLATLLHVAPGERVHLALREGSWPEYDIVVRELVNEPFGLQLHLPMAELNRWLGDRGALTSALLRVDMNEFSNVEQKLKQLPWIASVSSPHDFQRQFDEQSAAMMNFFTLIMTLFSAVIAIGVVYNNARVALSQRSRDLASLRVLGFTRREIASIIFGEQAVQVVLALPIGLVIGEWLSQAMMSNVDPEAYRFYVRISTQTYLFAIGVTIASAVLSAFILRRKIHRLDLIGVLKTRE